MADGVEIPAHVVASMDQNRATVWRIVEQSVAPQPGDGEALADELNAMGADELRPLLIAALRDLTLLHIRTGLRVMD